MTTTDPLSRVPVPADLHRVLHELGIKAGREDEREIWGLCPAHRKRTGKIDRRATNWSINRETGDHFCFACGYRGSLVGLVMDQLFPNDVFNARRWLRRFGVDLDAPIEIPEWSETKERVSKRELLAGVEFGEAWLEQYDPVPDEALDERGISREAAEYYGILWDVDADGWILPIRDPSDFSLWGWQLKAPDRVRNYPKNTVPKKKTLFGIERLSEGAMATLVESPLDCAVLATEGITGGVSSFGVQVSDEQMRLLVERTDAVMLALDNDAEGRRMTERLLANYGRRLHIRVLSYEHSPEAKDVGEMTGREITLAMQSSKHSTEVRWHDEAQVRSVRRTPRVSDRGAARRKAAQGRTW